jgi:hypothetical protein
MATLDKLYYVNVGPAGTFKPSGNSQFDSTPQDVDKIFENLQQKNRKKIVLYFHGGLVNQNAGMGTAERITRYINNNTDAHPISFVWETGFIETIKQNIEIIHSTTFFKKLLEKIIKVAGKKLGIDVDTVIGKRGVGNLSYPEIRAELNTEAPFDDYTVNTGTRAVTIVKDNLGNELELEVDAELEEEIQTDAEFLEIVENETQGIQFLNPDKIEIADTGNRRGILTALKIIKAAVVITLRVIKRHLKNRDHGFYPTIIEEIMRELYLADFGAWLWNAMKEKSAQMWLEDEQGAGGLNIKAGNYLVSKLKAYCDANNNVTIDLVGHSAGSIAICNLIKEMSSRNINLPVRNIIFMAPACRCELFHDSIFKNKNKFKSFRMFTMEDELEKKDRLVPVLYTRSLLYLVSGALEDKGVSSDAFIFGLQRHIKGKAPYTEFDILNDITSFLNEDKNRSIYSLSKADALDGFKTQSKKHGDFDNEGEPTLDSIVHIIKQ